ncbi:hypothetical protein [Streptomyces goshikiensis]|uniref:hypothetical protein n=1 Tax=Streptomyces goshikiensis TaxID=1942 RepID=UPI0036B43DF4
MAGNSPIPRNHPTYPQPGPWADAPSGTRCAAVEAAAAAGLREQEPARDLLVRALALSERAGHTEIATLAHQHLTHHLLADGSPAEAAAHGRRGRTRTRSARRLPARRWRRSMC